MCEGAVERKWQISCILTSNCFACLGCGVLRGRGECLYRARTYSSARNELLSSSVNLGLQQEGTSLVSLLESCPPRYAM